MPVPRQGDRPSIHVLYGQPDHLSTSYQTAQLMRAVRPHLSVTERRFANKNNGRYPTQLKRLWSNVIEPHIRQPRTDYVFYGNDGFADLRNWNSRRVVYWMDAPWDYSALPPRRTQWKDWLRYQNIRCAEFIFAVSEIQVKVARRLRPGREASVHYLPVGVDCQHYRPENGNSENVRNAYGIPSGSVVVGYLGYLGIVGDRFAGQILIDAATGLADRSGLHFLVVGFGPALPQFQQQVAAHGLTSKFTFTGYIPPERLPSFISCMDICIDTLEPGFHSEARSETKLKQYMAMGRACVATSIGENCVDLAHGQCGILVEAGAEALCNGIASLAANAEGRATFGSASRERALDSYDWPVLASRMTNTLEQSSSPDNG